MTTVTTCSNPAEAMLLKSLLEANGITAFVPDELSVQTAPNYAAAGIHLQVPDEQAETARQLLADAQKAFADEDDEDDEEDEDEEEGRAEPR